MSSPTKTVRWGIVATGSISKVFVTDLLIDPRTRGVTDVRHEVAAVASRSVDKARAFADGFGLSGANAYGSVEDLLADKCVDVVYIGAPNSHHYPYTRQALLAGKPVLCEKGFVVNAAQAKDLVRISHEKGVYLHEALWTRHFPMTIKIQDLITEGKLGNIERIFSEYGADANIDEMDPTHRLIDPSLGGGCILDITPYALCWVLVPLFPYPAEPTKANVAAQLTIAKGIDVHASAILTFEGLEGTQAIISSSMRQAPPHPIVIQGTKGEITVIGKASNPVGFTFTPKGGETQTFDYPAPEAGDGLFWEADDAARNLLAGRIESPRQTHATSIAAMEILDAMRAQANFKFSDELERVL